MKLRGIVLFVAIVVLVAPGIEAQRKKARKGRKDGCHLREIESCINKVQDLGKRKEPSVLIASNEGLNTICKAIRVDLSKCIKSFMKKCGTPLHREVADLITDQITSQVSRFCDEKNIERKEFLKHSPCLHKKVFSSQSYRTTCNNNFLNTVDSLDSRSNTADASHSDNTHHTVCCGYNGWHHCTKKMVIKECGKGAHDSFSTFVGEAFGTLPNMACPEDLFAPTSATCTAITPRVGKVQKGKGHNSLTKYITSHLAFLFVLN